MSEFSEALRIAAEAHGGQKDRFGRPFILHPIRVMLRMDPDSEEGMTTALLHDVVEKSSWTIEGLRSRGFSSSVVEAVERLTKRTDEPYMEYIRRVSGNALAAAVKRADLEDHLESLRERGLLEQDPARKARYDRSFRVLNRGCGRTEDEI